MNPALLTGPELALVGGVLFLIGLACYVEFILPDESDFGPAGQAREMERRQQLDAAVDAPLEPIRRLSVSDALANLATKNHQVREILDAKERRKS